MKRLSEAQAKFLDEPVGKYFIKQPDLYCSYCDRLIEPEYWCTGDGVCHLCGEYHWLYEKED